MKILLVEDSATLRYAMEAYIHDAGHESLIAENGETAVQIIEQQAIDMILMDVEMPGLDGFETTRLIRESLGEHWIPIIFVSGKSDEASLEEGIAVGGDDYLIKPVSKVILQAKIKAMERIANMRSQLHTLNTELTLLSQHDGLTGLLNRRTFDSKAKQAWRMATRSKEPLSILLFDIDFFKRYNDNYGHPAGDVCIQGVSDAVRKCFNRPGDIVARYGGEEFIALLPNTDHEGALHIAESVRHEVAALSMTHKGSPEHHIVTISIGASALKYTTGASLKQVIESADQALYDSKENGRNCTHVRQFRSLHKVLLIDDNADNAATIIDTLDDHCELEVICEDHKDTHLDNFGPELVILAAESDDTPAVKCYKRLKQSKTLSATPLLLMSSLGAKALKPIGKQLGANGNIEIPIDANHMISKVNQFFM